jgi:hypothetical protein
MVIMAQRNANSIIKIEPGIITAIFDHFFGPFLATSSAKSLSSSRVHGPYC